MNVKRYLETVKKYFIPFYKRMKKKYGNDVVIQEDNTPWHTAKVVQAFWEGQKIKKLGGPPQSPDMSLIENVWRYIKTILGNRRHRIKTIKDMERALHEVWPEIKGDFLLKLNASMPQRLDACIKNMEKRQSTRISLT